MISDNKSLQNHEISWLGGKYIGQLLNNIPEGQGTFILPNGTKYIGEWISGKPNGKGTITYSSGNRYEGEFRNGKRHGYGKFIKSDGSIINGLWGKGELIKPVMEHVTNGSNVEREPNKDFPNTSAREYEYNDCPYCGEEIQASSIKCKYCLTELNNASQKAKVRKSRNVIKKSIWSKWWVWAIIISSVTMIIIAIYSLSDPYDPINTAEYVTSENTAVDVSHEESSVAEVQTANKGKELVTIESTGIIIQSEEHKTLYPDMIEALIKNNSNETLREYTVGLLAYDKNGYPVKIEFRLDFGGASYERFGHAEDVNVLPGKTAGKDYGWGLDKNHNIHYVLAKIYEATFYDGTTWINPYYNDWRKEFIEKPLPERYKN